MVGAGNGDDNEMAEKSRAERRRRRGSLTSCGRYLSMTMGLREVVRLQSLSQEAST